jgi:hypothetical protein
MDSICHDIQYGGRLEEWGCAYSCLRYVSLNSEIGLGGPSCYQGGLSE